MQEEYEDVVSYKRWDKKRECYVNREGEPVAHKKDIVYNDVVLIVPRSGEYYSNASKDKTYAKKLEKIIRDVMISCLGKKDEERMKKDVEDIVDELKKIAEEVKVEAVKDDDVKIDEEEKLEEKVGEEEVVIKEQQVEEADKKVESLVEVKDEILKVASDGC
ncbi:hypothetical protein Hanom_Chr15g01406941 [Helianthus anomalus]